MEARPSRLHVVRLCDDETCCVILLLLKMRLSLSLSGMANGLSDLESAAAQHFHPEAESDADEEVRSLDLPGKSVSLFF